tara:strand:+ start:287 stop:547 length:261 start_codon:yes stop_codon:yes gene_type:complete
MISLFERSKPSGDAIKRLKEAISDCFKIPETTTLAVAELNCQEPDCPPVETLITAHKEDGTLETWRIGKRIDDIEVQDILTLKDDL